MDYKYNKISGYWIDDNTHFEDYITTAYHDGDLKNIEELDDDSIFFYGIDRESIDKAIKNKDVINGEFIIETVESIQVPHLI